MLAVGTQPRARVAGALTFRDQRDVPRLRRTIAELESGTIRRLVLRLTAGVSWPLPLYELAQVAAQGHAAERGTDVEVALATPERAPLETLGGEASALIAACSLIAECISSGGRSRRRCGARVGSSWDSRAQCRPTA